MTNNVNIKRAEMTDYLIEEIYKLLMCLRNQGIMNDNEVDNYYKLLMENHTRWCRDNLNHKEFTQYILNLLHNVEEKHTLHSYEED